MGDHPQNAPSLLLEDETESLSAGQNLVLVGKILAPKPLRKQGVLHTINAMWKTKKGVTTSYLGENKYGFTFESEDDFNRIFDLAPWSIMGRMLVLRRWEPSMSIEELEFDHGPFWIQAHGLPLNQMTESNGMKIGNLVGLAMKVQIYGGNQGAILGFMRIRVWLDLTKPLPTGFYLKRVGKKDSWVRFLYERLSDFCYDCGRVSHVRTECQFSEESSDSGIKFGPELRAGFYHAGAASFVVQSEKMVAPLKEDTVREVSEKVCWTGGSLEAVSQGTEEGVGGGLVGSPTELYNSQATGKLYALGDVRQVMDLSSFPAKEKDLVCCNEGKVLLEKDLVGTGVVDSGGLKADLAQSYYVEEPPDSPSQSFPLSPSSQPTPGIGQTPHVPIGPLVPTYDPFPTFLTQPMIDVGLSNIFNKNLSLKRKASPDESDPTYIKAQKLIEHSQSSRIGFNHSQINPTKFSSQNSPSLNSAFDPLEYPHTNLAEYDPNLPSQISLSSSTFQNSPENSFALINPSPVTPYSFCNPHHKPTLTTTFRGKSSNKGVVRRSPRRGVKGDAVKVRDNIDEGRLVDAQIFQGIGRSLTVRALRNFAKNRRPSIVFLMETKNKANKVDRIRRSLNFSNSVYVDPCGLSGGLALWWNSNISVDILEANQHFIHARCNDHQGLKSFLVTFVYGAPVVRAKEAVWENLRFLGAGIHGAWLVLGDFNDIVAESEKSGGSPPNVRRMTAFNEVLEDCGLMDLEFKGPRFTWRRNWQNGEVISERLNRAVANVEWRELFPFAVVFNEVMVGSDHSPIALDTNPKLAKPRKVFRFESFWTTEEECGEINKQEWSRDLGGSAMSKLERLLHRCKFRLHEWGKLKFGSFKLEAEGMLSRLAEIQGDPNPEQYSQESVTSLIRWFDNILALDDRSLALVIQICWAIWLARNDFLFNGNKINAHATVSRAFVGCSDFLDAIYLQGHPPISHSGEGCNVQKWQLPQMGRWKFNCDGAFCPKSKTAAFSIVVRDSVGRLISTNYGRIKVSSALAAEAWAIRVACAMVKSWGISAIIESDAKRAIQLCLNREGDSCKDIQTIIDDSLSFIFGCNVIFSWCKRSANSCANWIACRARKGLLPPPPLSLMSFVSS
ncbi:hypothetical protein Vadar_013640 [Vaccinium darrowii]|uniref:Uncharacterized protein n=1 Tax=Vaccinium darrowii TaxID=229202 RepID=A0ACB7YV89_9ERIC|nr:hypothetical protein Vadar_013640 [Vaccinium darrowii]